MLFSRLILMLLVLFSLAAPVYASEIGFDHWLTRFKDKAVAQGIAQETLDRALEGIEEDKKVVALDRKQPEKKFTLTQYLDNTVTPRRIALGRELLAEHRSELERISAQYGVQAEYIVALWGIETDYGNYTGGFSVIQSLATLAYEGRRAAFFEGELLAALRILEAENMSPDAFTGSWAGALGNCQFMPTTYLKHAVDWDGDGKRDIWNSLPDTFASIANYLNSLGWNATQSWGMVAVSPAGFKPAKEALRRGKTATSWAKLGVTPRDSEVTWLQDDTILYAVYPGSTEQGVFLVTENYNALLHWNHSRYFATAVGTLAEAIGDES